MASTMQLAIEIVGRDEASKPIKNVATSLVGLEKQAKSTGGVLGGLTATLGKVGLAGLGIATMAKTVGAAVGGLGKTFIGSNIAVQNARTGLIAMTKSAQTADKIIEDVRKEAARTPFAFEEMANAAAGLLPASKQANVGLMDLLQTAEVLAASNPAEGLEGAAFALREAVSGDFTSIIERFNLPRQRINQLKEEGVPALKAVTQVMRELGLDMDLVRMRSEDFEGRWSTLLDTVSEVARTLGKPLFDVLTRSLGTLQAYLDANAPAIQAWAERTGEAIARFVTDGVPKLVAAFGQVVAAVTPVYERLSTFLGSLRESETLAIAVNKAFGDLIPFALNKTLDDVDKAFADVKKSIQGVIDTLEKGGIPALFLQIQAAAELAFPKTTRLIEENRASVDRLASSLGLLRDESTDTANTIRVDFSHSQEQADTAMHAIGAAIFFADDTLNKFRISVNIATAGIASGMSWLAGEFEKSIYSMDGAMHRFSAAIVASFSGLGPRIAAALRAEFAKIRVDMGPFHLSASGFTVDAPRIITPFSPPAAVTPAPSGQGGRDVVGYQHGGSFRVGGRGGADSQLVAFRATPGERVTVQTPAQQAASAVNVVVNVGEVRDRSDADYLAALLPEALSRALEKARSQQGFPAVSGLVRMQ